jgi:serine/threonine-protein kinase
MGQVFKGICVDESTGTTREVAIKFVYSDLPPQALERARREASIQLRNDNLIEMLGFIEIDEPQPDGTVARRYHVVSELLTGVSLSDLLEGKTKDRNGEDVPFAVKMLQDYRNDPDHFARTIVMGVLSGLMALHDAGYIHRDIDPSNIMLTAEGRIKLIDFGIAKQLNELTTGDRGLTVAGAFMGKPEYAAPELALGDIKHQNQTTDIYAVGILLYQCIVGHTPFEGPRHEVLDKQVKSKLPLAAIKNKGLRGIIATACKKRQELRYQTSAQMRVALEALGGSRRAMATSTKVGIAAAIAAAIIVLVGIVGVVKYKQDEAQRREEIARLEQQKAELEAEITSIVNSGQTELANAKDEETDNFEDHIISAAQTFGKALAKAKGTDLEATVRADYDTTIAKLRSTKSVFEGKVQESKSIGDSDGAAFFQQRADKIGRFLETVHIKPQQ